MGQPERTLAEDERALMSCLPEDGRPAANQAVLLRLGWDENRYLSARARLAERGDIYGFPGVAGTIQRNLTPRLARVPLGEDEKALLGCLPRDGSPAGGKAVRRQLGWDRQRYAGARAGLEERGYLARGRGGAVRRNLAAVPPEFRPACGRPGSHVTVRHMPVTIPHALCDLTGVRLTYPGRGVIIVPRPGLGIGHSSGIKVEVDSETRDVTVVVTGPAGNL